MTVLMYIHDNVNVAVLMTKSLW